MIMSEKVVLNKRTQKLIKRFIELLPIKTKELLKWSSPIEMEDTLAWLCSEIKISSELSDDSKQEIEFVLASLRAELLHDLHETLEGGSTTSDTAEEQSFLWTSTRLILLALAGTLLSACQGFDSITTLLGMFSLAPTFILIAGLIFSILSIIVFYSYDLVQVSKNLGVTVRNAPKLLDIYIQQMRELKNLRNHLEHYPLATLSMDNLQQLQYLNVMLQLRFQSVVIASKQFNKALNSNMMKGAKYLITGLAGLLFFCSGFFAGHSVAMYIAAFFSASSVVPTFWPVLLFGAVVGLAAFVLYWHLEQEGLNKLISGWFGLDEDKIQLLCDEGRLDKESGKLERLKNQIISTARLNDHLELLQHQAMERKETEHYEVKERLSIPSKDKVSANRFCFLNPIQQDDILNEEMLSSLSLQRR